MNRRLFTAALASTLIPPTLLLPSLKAGEGHCCQQCGCNGCRKVCRLVPDVKKVEKICWTCEEEDLCLQGKSQPAGETCVPDCNAPGGIRKLTLWRATCDRVMTRKKIKKQVVTIEKPTFKCVVEIVCPQCGACTAEPTPIPAAGK